MLIPPGEAAVEPAEWQDWLAATDRFGVLAVPHTDRTRAPLVVPTHFTLAGPQLLLHLAGPNPVWPHLEAAGQVRRAVVGAYAYIPRHWRARAGGPDEDGVPTSYYATVQFVCSAMIVDDPQGKVDMLSAQPADLQPEGGHAEVGVDDPPYGRMLPGIRGVRLTVLEVEATLTYDDANPLEHRERVSRRLDERDQCQDAAAAAQQRRRRCVIGAWNPRTDPR